jgi:hypothetical protein
MLPPELVKVAAAGAWPVDQVDQVGRFDPGDDFSGFQCQVGGEAFSLSGETAGKVVPERAAWRQPPVLQGGFVATPLLGYW